MSGAASATEITHVSIKSCNVLVVRVFACECVCLPLSPSVQHHISPEISSSRRPGYQPYGTHQTVSCGAPDPEVTETM